MPDLEPAASHAAFVRLSEEKHILTTRFGVELYRSALGERWRPVQIDEFGISWALGTASFPAGELDAAKEHLGRLVEDPSTRLLRQAPQLSGQEFLMFSGICLVFVAMAAVLTGTSLGAVAVTSVASSLAWGHVLFSPTLETSS